MADVDDHSLLTDDEQKDEDADAGEEHDASDNEVDARRRAKRKRHSKGSRWTKAKRGRSSTGQSEKGSTPSSVVENGANGADASMDDSDAIATPEEVCKMYGMSDVALDWSEDESASVSSVKTFNARVKPLLSSANPRATSARLQALLAAKWRQFQNATSKSVAHNSQGGSEKVVAPLKIRISTRTSKRKQPDDSDEEKEVLKSQPPTPEEPPPPPPPNPTKSSGGHRRERSHYGGHNSDAEFEAMLREHDKELDAAEKEKQERRKKRQQAAAAANSAPTAAENRVGGMGGKMPRTESKPRLRDSKDKKKRKDEDGYETDHQDYCEMCQAGGEVILCDTCPRAYHLVCLDPDMDQAPEGRWSCPHCESEGPERPSTTDSPANNQQKAAEQAPAEPQRTNMDTCKNCGNKGGLLMCDSCPMSFHAYCLNPPLEEAPDKDEDWHCPRCTCEAPSNRPERVLSWRWVEVKIPPPLTDEEKEKLKSEKHDADDSEKEDEIPLRPPKKIPPRREKELFIKWKYMSYWHCNWVNELVIEVHHMQFLRMYWRRNDPNVPPEVDDGSQEDLETGKIENKEKEADVHNMEEKFYRYGIKPEWMQVHRIVNHMQYNKNQFDYLVKWRELPYEQASWERDDMDIPGYHDAIMSYWRHRERMNGEQLPKAICRKYDIEPLAASELGGKRDKRDGKKKAKEVKGTCDVRLS